MTIGTNNKNYLFKYKIIKSSYWINVIITIYRVKRKENLKNDGGRTKESGKSREKFNK